MSFLKSVSAFVGKKKQFKKHEEWEGEYFGTPYDINSLMHYTTYAFSKNNKPTITGFKGEIIEAVIKDF